MYSKISQANREQEEREARARREAEQRRLREIQERAAAEERRKHEAYLQRRRTDPYFDMMERQKEERVKAEAERKRRAEEEAKCQAELTRHRNLAAQFKYITLGGHKAAYCFDYYPKNRFPSVTAQQEADRRAVWNFKDGSYSYGLNRLADFLDGNFKKEEMKNVVVCVIPASAQCKNDIRYAIHGINIISGLAVGCDSIAHESALSVGGTTTAVLAGGLDNIYPKENKGLADRILSNSGLLLSENPVFTQTNKYNLVARDRIQAALGNATLVIQTSINGGTMHAAKATLVAEKPLFVVDYKDNSADVVQGNLALKSSGAHEISSSSWKENSLYYLNMLTER